MSRRSVHRVERFAAPDGPRTLLPASPPRARDPPSARDAAHGDFTRSQLRASRCPTSTMTRASKLLITFVAVQHLLFLVLEMFQDRVYGLALRFLWAPQDAEDATQEILVRIITRLSSFEGRSEFTTWAHRVAVNHLTQLQEEPRRAGRGLARGDRAAARRDSPARERRGRARRSPRPRPHRARLPPRHAARPRP